MKAIHQFFWGPQKRLKRLMIFLGVAALYVLPLVTIPGLAAIYMKYDGIDGDVIAKGHEGWIKIESVEFGVSRQIPSLPGEPRIPGPPTHTDLSLVKVVDKASPLLFLEAVRGDLGKFVTIDFTKSDADGIERLIYQLNLSDVLVSGFSQSSGYELPLENVSFHFDKLELKYFPPAAAGGTGEPITAVYDFLNRTTQ